MPYIKQWVREKMDDGITVPHTAGELNYRITKEVNDYIGREGVSYSTLNEIVGVLECVKQELYRRVVSPYEDEKIKENGDVFNTTTKGGTVNKY